MTARRSCGRSERNLHMHRPMRRVRGLQIFMILGGFTLLAPTASAESNADPPILGRWDLRVSDSRGAYPSWLEVTLSGSHTLVGRFVGRVGSARPISRVDFSGGAVRFAIPPQWDRDTADLRFDGRLDADRLTGTISNPDGSQDSFTGTRAPALIRASP